MGGVGLIVKNDSFVFLDSINLLWDDVMVWMGINSLPFYFSSLSSH